MAHGSYDCCAICDSKMAFNEGDARTKETPCTGCAVALARLGIFATTAKELLSWMETETPEKVLATLKSVGFSTCIYPNDVDQKYVELGGEPAPAWWRTLFKGSDGR
jgi:hypothetical protein